MISLSKLEKLKSGHEHAVKVLNELIKRVNDGEKVQDMIMYNDLLWYKNADVEPCFNDRSITLKPKKVLKEFTSASEATHLIDLWISDKHSVVSGYIKGVTNKGVLYTRTKDSQDYRFCNYVYLAHNCTSTIPLGIFKSE